MAREDYVKKDLAGYPFNSKYPPDVSDHDNLYHGYKSDVEETLFYDFAVQGNLTLFLAFRFPENQ